MININNAKRGTWVEDNHHDSDHWEDYNTHLLCVKDDNGCTVGKVYLMGASNSVDFIIKQDTPHHNHNLHTKKNFRRLTHKPA
jgi:hypothetical protein